MKTTEFVSYNAFLLMVIESFYRIRKGTVRGLLGFSSASENVDEELGEEVNYFDNYALDTKVLSVLLSFNCSSVVLTLIY